MIVRNGAAVFVQIDSCGWHILKTNNVHEARLNRWMYQWTKKNYFRRSQKWMVWWARLCCRQMRPIQIGYFLRS